MKVYRKTLMCMLMTYVFLETIGDKKTSSEVRVKWFVPCNGQHYRFPARISPNFKIKNKDECYGKFIV